MENRKEFTFPSADGRTAIHAVEWHPEREPAGVLQIAHGVAEYALRYEPFARFLNAHGFLVVANDHLGHGESVAEGAPRLYFGEKGSWQHVVDDMYTLRCRTGEAYPELPYFIMGHSMGSFLTRTYLIRYPGTVKGAILMGTGQNPDAMLVGGKALASVLARKAGRENVSDVVEKLAFGAYNKAFAPNRTGYDWLSVSEENVDAYIADPLCGGMASTGLFLELLGGMAFIKKPANLRHMNMATPVLFISGDRDPVGGMGKGVRAACDSFRRAGVRDAELKLYPGLRHEILNEDCRAQVYDDLWEWVERHNGETKSAGTAHAFFYAVRYFRRRRLGASRSMSPQRSSTPVLHSASMPRQSSTVFVTADGMPAARAASAGCTRRTASAPSTPHASENGRQIRPLTSVFVAL